MNWSIVPWLNQPDMTMQACKDLAEQGADARVLVVGVGVAGPEREEMERFVQYMGEKVLAWYHEPGLPSLSATWNRALQFVWETGGEVALVANNDVRVTPDTFAVLKEILEKEKALLVTATGVEEEETLFDEARKGGQRGLAYAPCPCNPTCPVENDKHVRRGGPGFSLFMISKEANEKYPFDEALVPAFCEDLDLHRRMILGGDGNRIFGTNVRYLHLGGQTLKAMTPERRKATEEAISRGSRAHYARKWGGGANEETFIVPFENVVGAPEDPAIMLGQEWVLDRVTDGLAVTTPALFEEIRRGWE